MSTWDRLAGNGSVPRTSLSLKFLAFTQNALCGGLKCQPETILKSCDETPQKRDLHQNLARARILPFSPGTQCNKPFAASNCYFPSYQFIFSQFCFRIKSEDGPGFVGSGQVQRLYGRWCFIYAGTTGTSKVSEGTIFALGSYRLYSPFESINITCTVWNKLPAIHSCS